MGICEIDEDGTYKTSQLNLDNTQNTAKSVIQWTVIAAVIGAMIFFFYFRRNQSKPRFVKAIMGILVAVCILNIIKDSIEFHIDKGFTNPPKLATTVNVIVTIKSSLCSVCHWIFASKYFELALHLPIYLGFVKS